MFSPSTYTFRWMHYPYSALSRVLRTIIGLCFFQWGHEERDAFHHLHYLVRSVWSDGLHVRRKRWQRVRRVMSILVLFFWFNWKWNGARLLCCSSPVWDVFNGRHLKWLEHSEDRFTYQCAYILQKCLWSAVITSWLRFSSALWGLRFGKLKVV